MMKPGSNPSSTARASKTDGKSKFWSVQDGAITGQTTKENPAPGNTFCIWRGGEVDDFELKAEFKIIGHNSGIQYRSFEVPNQKWVVGGYQADMEAGDTFTESSTKSGPAAFWPRAGRRP